MNAIQEKLRKKFCCSNCLDLYHAQSFFKCLLLVFPVLSSRNSVSKRKNFSHGKSRQLWQQNTMGTFSILSGTVQCGQLTKTCGRENVNRRAHGGRMYDKKMACRTRPRITPQTKFILHPKYYKHLKEAGHHSHLGR